MNSPRSLLPLLAAHQKNPDDGEIAYQLTQITMGKRSPLQAARFMASQADLSRYAPDDLLKFNQHFPKRFLNIGGGPRFLYPYWANLEEAPGPLNPAPFKLGSDCRFPFPPAAFDLVYSSHCLEHLDEPTVATVIREARRVIHPDGALLIKLPNYDTLLDAYRRGDDEYFSDAMWGLSSVTATLHNRGLRDSIHIRAAYIICGFWNKQFGHLYIKADPSAPGAYNGPPAMPEPDLIKILSQSSPAAIARDLRRRVVEAEPDYTFNHQNAWSEDEFSEVLAGAGFELLSRDKDKIVRRFSYVPKIRDMAEISSYFVAVPHR